MSYFPGDYVSTPHGVGIVCTAIGELVSCFCPDDSAPGRGGFQTMLAHDVRLLYPGPEHGGSITDAARRAMAPVRKLVPEWDAMEREIAEASSTPATDLAALQNAMNNGDAAGIARALGLRVSP